MKLQANRTAASAATTPKVEAGRQIGTIVQVVNIGMVPGFNKDDAPQHHVGIGIELASGTIVGRSMAANTSPYALLGSILDAIGLASEGEESELDLKDLLGNPVAVEIELSPQGFVKLTSFSPLEEFESKPVMKSKPIYLDFTEKPYPADFNAHFQGLCKDLRLTAGRRIRV